MKKICLIFPAFVLVCLLLAASCAQKTVIYYKGGSVSLDNPDIKVNKIFGIKLSPQEKSVNCTGKEVWVPFYIENVGNDSNNIKLEARFTDDPRGWTVNLVEDRKNEQPKMEWDENQLFFQLLGEGGLMHFFLVLKKPDSARTGDIQTAEVRAVGYAKDGSSYTGFNGVRYGGEDEVVSLTYVVVK